MPLEQVLNRNEIVCFLIVNYIPYLPSISVGSCLTATDCPIVIGYLNEDDLRDIPASPRITRLDLREIASCRTILGQIDSGVYRHFGTQDFFNLVQLKWYLFLELMCAGFQRVIYSDIDTVWVQDAVAMTNVKNADFFVQIQDVTVDMRNPRLCMGFISIVNNPTTFKMIEICAQENERRLLTGEQIGDDDIISDYYRDQGYPNWIQTLPQLAFPTGNMLTQYISKPAFRPVEPPKPIIFHANYIIGQKNKAIVLERFSNRLNLRTAFELSLGEKLILNFSFFMVRLKFWANRFKRVLNRTFFKRSSLKAK